jgi:Mn2+/Fe2+ NRAMP family transporter
MTRNELLLHIHNCEKLNERRKLKRFIYTVLFYAAVYMVICYWQGQLGRNIWDILSAVVLCLILAIPTVLANTIIFDQLIRKSQEEDAALEYLRKRLREKEQEDDYKGR